MNSKLEETWTGTIYFNDSTELTCQFTMNWREDDVLIVKTDTSTNVYGVNLVKSFSFFDDELEKRRYFFTLPIKSHVIRKYFFELIHESREISLLSYNSYTTSNVYGTGYYGNQKTNAPKIKAKKILCLLDYRENEIYVSSRSELLRMTEDHRDEIQAFVKSNKLSFAKPEDFISVIDYYSSLK